MRRWRNILTVELSLSGLPKAEAQTRQDAHRRSVDAIQYPACENTPGRTVHVGRGVSLKSPNLFRRTTFCRRAPHWITAPYAGVCKCGQGIATGDRVWYWPSTRTIECHACGTTSERRLLECRQSQTTTRFVDTKANVTFKALPEGWKLQRTRPACANRC